MRTKRKGLSMCGNGFFAIGELIAEGNLAVSDSEVARLPFDPRDLPCHADGVLITIRAITALDTDSIFISRRAFSVADMPTKAAISLTNCLGSMERLMTRGAFANGEAFQFLASAAGASIAYSIETVTQDLNQRAME